jgi:hypothetical protein
MSSISVSLTGGLGNQLFQLSAALSIANGRPIEVEWRNSKPRLNKDGLPEILEFELPYNVIFKSDTNFNWLTAKLIGHLLRLGVENQTGKLRQVEVHVVSLLASLGNFLSLRKMGRIPLNFGVGYSPISLRDRESPRHLVGYFQTYRWTEECQTSTSILSARLRPISLEINQLKIEAVREQPLVVHMRFTDYRKEDSFGILTPRYYLESIRELWATGLYKAIWVFSDEIQVAKQYLDGWNQGNLRFISDVEGSSARTLARMRA